MAVKRAKIKRAKRVKLEEKRDFRGFEMTRELRKDFDQVRAVMYASIPGSKLPSDKAFAELLIGKAVAILKQEQEVNGKQI